MILYIRTPADLPHTPSADDPELARCGVLLIGAKEVTEEQVLAFLGDKRCAECTPGWVEHQFRKGRGRGCWPKRTEPLHGPTDG